MVTLALKAVSVTGNQFLGEDDRSARDKMNKNFELFWERKRSDQEEMTARDAIVNSLCPMLSGMFGIKLSVLLMLLGGTDGSVQRRASGGQTHNIYETESSGGAHTGDAKGTAGDTSTQVDTSYDPVTQLKKYDSNAGKPASRAAARLIAQLDVSFTSLTRLTRLTGEKSWSARPNRATRAPGPRYTCSWWETRERESRKSRGLWYVSLSRSNIVDVANITKITRM